MAKAKSATPAPPARKSGRKTPSKTPAKKKGRERTLRTPAHGKGQLMSGGTNAGGPGRPPNAAKAHLEKVLYGKKHQRAATRVLENENHAQFTSFSKMAYLYVVGIPKPEDPGAGGPGVILDL